MRLLFLSLAATAISLSGCESAGDRAKDDAQEAVANLMKDPSSVQFRSVKADGDTVCGEVNGKNSFGAYEGFQRFRWDREHGPNFESEIETRVVPEMVKESLRGSWRVNYDSCQLNGR